MACKLVEWLIASAGPSALQHGLVGVACLLAYDAANRWRKRRSVSPTDESKPEEPANEYRRAA
jgi:hypothetical protein